MNCPIKMRSILVESLAVAKCFTDQTYSIGIRLDSKTHVNVSQARD